MTKRFDGDFRVDKQAARRTDKRTQRARRISQVARMRDCYKSFRLREGESEFGSSTIKGQKEKPKSNSITGTGTLYDIIVPEQSPAIHLSQS